MTEPADIPAEELEKVKRELARKLEEGQTAVVSRIARGNVRLQSGRYVTKAQLDREFEDIMAERWDQVEQ
ncbi:MAG: hypothetical protein OXJ53_16280 [Gammaproteobacteria bacterium]|nr:hypothetical protein [Gammaproteobacteria bacterium]